MKRIFWLPVVVLLLVIVSYLRSCDPRFDGSVVVPKQTPLEAFDPAMFAKTVHDTVARVRIEEKVVVKNVYVPRVAPDADKKPKYRLKTPNLVVVAKTDSSGLLIDSLVAPNKKEILIGIDGKGKGMLTVKNSNPLFETANIEGMQFEVPVYRRVTWGLQGGVYMTPVGPQVGIGVGINFALSRKR